MKKLSLSLAIMNLNEMEGLKVLLPKIPIKEVDECFAVDGGSTDGSLELFARYNIPVHKQQVKGRGDAFRLAFEKSMSDAVIFFSPDGNENPEDIHRFSSYFKEGYDIVIANRMSHGGCNEEDHQIFKWRKWANNAFTLLANLTWNRTGIYIHDTINGYRGISKKAWHELKPDGDGYTIEYQTSIRAMKRGMKVKEFPTHESGRIDTSREGSPSISTGLIFIKLYLKELIKGDKF